MIPSRLLLLLGHRGPQAFPPAATAGPYWSAAAQPFSPGAAEGQTFSPGAVAVDTFSPGPMEGQAHA